jgi:hypothetical protein
MNARIVLQTHLRYPRALPRVVGVLDETTPFDVRRPPVVDLLVHQTDRDLASVEMMLPS